MADVSSKRLFKVKVFSLSQIFLPEIVLKSAENKTDNFNTIISCDIQMENLTGPHCSLLSKKIRNTAWGDV